MSKDSKLKTLIEEANKLYGAETIMLQELGMSMTNEKPEVISTGYLPLDDALGIGGYPIGRIVEIMGEEASGKSTLALHAIAGAQQKGLVCLYIDTEHALDSERGTRIGVDFEKLLISQPDSAEQALDLLDFVIRSGEVKLIVVDSVAALVPKAEIEGDVGDANIGVMARMMGKTLRKITAPANKNKVCVIFINQLRDKLGGFGFGPPQKVGAGGNALKFYSSIRIDMRRTGNNKNKEFSTNHKATIRKNKLAIPMKVVEFRIGNSGILKEYVG